MSSEKEIKMEIELEMTLDQYEALSEDIKRARQRGVKVRVRTLFEEESTLEELRSSLEDPDHVVENEWSSMQKWSLETLKEWFDLQYHLVDGRVIDVQKDLTWIKGEWTNRYHADFLYKRLSSPKEVPSLDIERAPVASYEVEPLHARQYSDVTSYAALESYKRNTTSHVPLVSDVLGQVHGQVIAPADSWGVVKSMRPDSVSGDLFPGSGVEKETIGETLQRGLKNLPVILSYAYTFCSEEEIRELEERPGPVIIIDEMPFLLKRGDLMSIGPNVVAYGTPVVQHYFGQDHTSTRERLQYDFNLLSRGRLSWRDWGSSLWHMIQTYPRVRHHSFVPHVAAALRLLNVYTDGGHNYVSHYLHTWLMFPGSYFVPIGRAQKKIYRAHGEMNWLFSRQVYRSDDPRYSPLGFGEEIFTTKDEAVVGWLHFIPHDFRVRWDKFGVAREAKTGMYLYSKELSSQRRFLRQYIEQDDINTAHLARLGLNRLLLCQYLSLGHVEEDKFDWDLDSVFRTLQQGGPVTTKRMRGALSLTAKFAPRILDRLDATLSFLGYKIHGKGGKAYWTKELGPCVSSEVS